MLRFWMYSKCACVSCMRLSVLFALLLSFVVCCLFWFGFYFYLFICFILLFLILQRAAVTFALSDCWLLLRFWCTCTVSARVCHVCPWECLVCFTFVVCFGLVLIFIYLLFFYFILSCFCSALLLFLRCRTAVALMLCTVSVRVCHICARVFCLFLLLLLSFVFVLFLVSFFFFYHCFILFHSVLFLFCFYRALLLLLRCRTAVTLLLRFWMCSKWASVSCMRVSVLFIFVF